MTDIDRQPTLTSPLIHLRPLRPDDWEALYAVARDPAIWALHPAHDRWQEPVFRRFFADALGSGGALLALDPVTGEVIGSSRYDLARAHPGEVEIGWTFLARRCWGGGVNADMKRLMVGHALRFVERVIFVVGENNHRSRRAMEKVGARLTGRVLDLQGSPGGRHLVYAIDREGFANGPLMTRKSPAPVHAQSVPAQAGATIYPAQFAARVAGRTKRKLGDRFGLTSFGVNLTRLAPGAASALMHYHTRQDEFVYVLEGTLVLRLGEEEHILGPGDCFGFKGGEPCGHQLVNRSQADAVYLEIGDRLPGDTVAYPEDDLAAESVPGGGWRLTHKDGTPY